MKKNYFLLFALLTFFSVTAQVTYNGNGNTGFGGTLGTGSLQISNTPTDLNFTFSRGSDLLSNSVVIYIDSEIGGFSDTTTFEDDADGLRSAISTFNGSSDPTVTFPAGFEADYALAFEVNFAGLWSLASGSDNSLGFETSANLSPTGDNAAASHSFSIALSDIGITASGGFDFVVTYISPTAFLSDEVIGSSSVSGNPADTGSLTFDGFETYSAVLDTEAFENRVTKVIVSPNKTITIYGMQSETIVRVYDMLGKEVLKQEISAEQNSIQASYLRSGVYIVKLNTTNSSETKKIIIN